MCLVWFRVLFAPARGQRNTISSRTPAPRASLLSPSLSRTFRASERLLHVCRAASLFPPARARDFASLMPDRIHLMRVYLSFRATRRESFRQEVYRRERDFFPNWGFSAFFFSGRTALSTCYTLKWIREVKHDALVFFFFP